MTDMLILKESFLKWEEKFGVAGLRQWLSEIEDKIYGISYNRKAEWFSAVVSLNGEMTLLGTEFESMSDAHECVMQHYRNAKGGLTQGAGHDRVRMEPTSALTYGVNTMARKDRKHEDQTTEGQAPEGQSERQPEEQTQGDNPTNAGAQVPTEAAKANKSIVPSKYANKYKKGGNDALAQHITAQTGGDLAKFFALCRANGIAEEKVAHYETQVTEKRPGANGRARMTLRNMLENIVRKADGKVKNIDGSETTVELAARLKPGTSQTAAAA